MPTRRTTTTRRTGRRPRRRITRRGVVGILAMMFLVMFASLAAAMATTTQGNLRSAASHLRVVRALGAVDSGMALAASRLREAIGRFVVSEGLVDADYVQLLWTGPVPNDPPVIVVDAPFGMEEAAAPESIEEALANIFAADNAANVIAAGTPNNAPAAIALTNPGNGWLVNRPVGVARNSDDQIVSAMQITYAPPDENGEVRVIVTGYDWDAARERWVTRTAEQRFHLNKSVDFALVATTPVLLGMGGDVEGPIGSLFDSHALDTLDGPPFRAISDFYGLAAKLDAKLNDYFAQVVKYDTDGDNRLRMHHAVESEGVEALALKDYDGDGAPDNAFVDLTKDNIIDDFDIFLNHFDKNGDGRVILSEELTEGTPAEAEAPEFEANDFLAYLIDSANVDRNRNGWSNGVHQAGDWDYDTFPDNNADGLKSQLDLDADDVTLGYRDGALDYRDQYAKIRGSVYLRASRTAWENAKNPKGGKVTDYQQYVQGAIRPDRQDSAMNFAASTGQIPDISDESFSEASEGLNELLDDADAPTFKQQVEAQKGAGWTPPTRVEATPFGSAAPADWYGRPVYEDMTFKNVTIPMGNNGLFINCTFVGITRVKCYIDNTHPSWTFYGEQQRDPVTGALTQVYPPPPAFSDIALDKSYSEAGAPGYALLPEKLVVPVDLNADGVSNDTCYDTKKLANNIRFHDCLFVGSIVADKATVYTHIRNKLQFSGATRFTQTNPDFPDDPDLNPDPDHRDEIAKSSMMVPNYSVDIGAINPPPEQDVKLQGAIVAGVLDIRGNAEIRGVVLSTFKPVYGVAPLRLYNEPVGNPADFNVTIGYVTTADGDAEALNPDNIKDLDGDGKLDIGWDSARDGNGALIPLAGWNGVQNESWYDGVPDTAAVAGTNVRRAIKWNPPGMTRMIADPDAILPDGLPLPMTMSAVAGTYREGHP